MKPSALNLSFLIYLFYFFTDLKKFHNLIKLETHHLPKFINVQKYSKKFLKKMILKKRESSTPLIGSL